MQQMKQHTTTIVMKQYTTAIVMKQHTTTNAMKQHTTTNVMKHHTITNVMKQMLNVMAKVARVAHEPTLLFFFIALKPKVE